MEGSHFQSCKKLTFSVKRKVTSSPFFKFYFIYFLLFFIFLLPHQSGLKLGGQWENWTQSWWKICMAVREYNDIYKNISFSAYQCCRTTKNNNVWDIQRSAMWWKAYLVITRVKLGFRSFCITDKNTSR